MNDLITSAIDTRFTPIPLAVTLAATFSFSAPVLANPEVGADYSRSANPVLITSTTSSGPTVLRTVTVVCPVAGFTIARADAQFGLYIANGYTVGNVLIGIIRNSMPYDSEVDSRLVRGRSPDSFEYTHSEISRSDPCRAGESVTYRFVAQRSSGLTEYSFAWTPALEVVAYRDRY